MAKKSMIARERDRVKLSNSRYESRQNLKEEIKKAPTFEKLQELVMKLNKRPRDESVTRVRRRCAQCGRPHGVLRKFRLCRLCLRKAIMNGDVPGARKSSW